MRFLRLLLGVASRYSADEARELACQAAAARGVVFVPPFWVAVRLKGYLVVSNAAVLGGNVTVMVDCRTGEVSDFHGPTPR